MDDIVAPFTVPKVENQPKQVEKDFGYAERVEKSQWPKVPRPPRKPEDPGYMGGRPTDGKEAKVVSMVAESRMSMATALESVAREVRAGRVKVAALTLMHVEHGVGNEVFFDYESSEEFGEYMKYLGFMTLAQRTMSDHVDEMFDTPLEGWEDDHDWEKREDDEDDGPSTA